MNYCCENSTKSSHYFRAIRGHSGGIPIDPELMGYVQIPYNWKKNVFTRGCSFSIQSIPENGLIPGGHGGDKGGQTIFITPLNPFGEDYDEEESREDDSIPHEVHYHSSWKRNQDADLWISTRFMIANLAHKVICDHHRQSCARRLHLQSDF